MKLEASWELLERKRSAVKEQRLRLGWAVTGALRHLQYFAQSNSPNSHEEKIDALIDSLRSALNVATELRDVMKESNELDLF
jgi:beta-galactosidase GanA